jgi:G:T/U-mismatch repair DNA glycosylase
MRWNNPIKVADSIYKIKAIPQNDFWRWSDNLLLTDNEKSFISRKKIGMVFYCDITKQYYRLKFKETTIAVCHLVTTSKNDAIEFVLRFGG